MVNAAAADIRPAGDEAGLRAAWPVVAQLRPHLDEDAFVAQALRQRAEGWQATVLVEDGVLKTADIKAIIAEIHRVAPGLFARRADWLAQNQGGTMQWTKA